MDSIFTAQSFLLTTTSSSLLILLILLHFSRTTSNAINPHCTPSACGIIRNISYPFRLKNDPHFCGDPRFELECEENVTSIYYDSHKYYVKAINYDNYTIRVVNASINNCSPSSCGIIRNISYPFRFKNDPDNCGDPNFELACENNVTSIYFDSHKYYVKAINYGFNFDFDDISSIRVVDASINNDDICSFPIYSIPNYNFTSDSPHRYPYRIPPYSIPNYKFTSDYVPCPINFISCPFPFSNSSLFTDITHCNSSSHPTRSYAYIKVGHLKASEIPEMCELDVIVMTAWKFKDFNNASLSEMWEYFKELNNVSLSEIHDSLLYGFELMICPFCTPSTVLGKYSVFFLGLIPTLVVIPGLLCAVVSPPVFTIVGFAALSLLLYTTFDLLFYISGVRETSLDGLQIGFWYLDTTNISYFNEIELSAIILSIMICAPRIIIFPLAVWFMIYKFRKRRFSIFDAIESFLQSDNKLTPIRYSYSDIKKMTRGFQDKLGEGGYGSVYKGKLRSGCDVAVKLLRKSGENGQDFMNEIATIGRIHHVNVVKLVGYCAQGSKRALVFDFMTNGSLDKYLFNREKMSFLNWETKFEIASGVARGIEYLHRGCDIQILHFDIKPHNILLDDKFIPKISDFGLAKSCSTDKKAVTMTAIRGTIGYVAPELISRSIGAVSYKADVYSFGMLLMELVGLNRDLKGSNGDSGQYFPYWIYDLYKQGKDSEIGSANEIEDSDSSRKLVRKMTVVALWCIQMSPDDRPSMSNVLQMLEGDVERLQIPECPSESTQIVVDVDESGISCWTDSEPLMRHDVASSSVEITVQE